jgi:hypothetical protein
LILLIEEWIANPFVTMKKSGARAMTSSGNAGGKLRVRSAVTHMNAETMCRRKTKSYQLNSHLESTAYPKLAHLNGPSIVGRVRTISGRIFAYPRANALAETSHGNLRQTSGTQQKM